MHNECIVQAIPLWHFLFPVFKEIIAETIASSHTLRGKVDGNSSFLGRSTVQRRFLLREFAGILLRMSPENSRFARLFKLWLSGDPMNAVGKSFASVTHFFRRLRGGSQPILVRASDGLCYVVKFHNNLQGPNLLFNEGAGCELYRACGLPVPEWTPLRISDSFLDRNPGCWIQTPEGRLRPASGLCYGSRFLDGNGKRLFEILPGSMLKRVRNQVSFWLVWLIDVCAEHVDNRQAIFEEDADGWLDAYFIDHGHLFGGPNADSKRHFGASRYLDQRIYGPISSEVLLGFQDVLHALDADRLRERIEAIPAEWSQQSAREVFERSLQRLKMGSLVRHVVETMISDCERRTDADSRIFGSEWKSLTEFLRLGVQGAELGRGYARNPHCA